MSLYFKSINSQDQLIYKQKHISLFKLHTKQILKIEIYM